MADIFRQEYKEVSTERKEYVAQIKAKAQELYDLLVNSEVVAVADGRALAIAKTDLENAIMWAVKGLTA